MYFGPRRMGKTEAMLNRAADKITEYCFPGTRADVCVVGCHLEQLMTNILSRLKEKLILKNIWLDPYQPQAGNRAFLARTKDHNESYPCVKVILLGVDGYKESVKYARHFRDGVQRQYFFDHTVLELEYGDILNQWLADVQSCGFKLVPVSKEAETASQFALREVEALRALSANSNLFKREYEGKWQQLPPGENAVLVIKEEPAWNNVETPSKKITPLYPYKEKKDTDGNNDPSKNTD